MALLTARDADAALPRRALLVGGATDAVLHRVANELGAAGFDVLVETELQAAEAAHFAQLAQQREAQAVVDFRLRPSVGGVAIYVTDRAHNETTLRRLKSRSGAEAETVLALRIVEVINGALLELERVTTAPARPAPPLMPRADADRTQQPAEPGFGLLLRGGERGLWLSGELSGFIGPELGLRASLPNGLFLDGSSFVSISSQQVRGAGGSADVRVLSADCTIGLSSSVGERFQFGAGLSGGLLGAWASADAAPGYRARTARGLSGSVSVRADARFKLFRALGAYAGLGAGRVLPPISVSLASEPRAGAGPWFAFGSVGLSLMWGG